MFGVCSGQVTEEKESLIAIVPKILPGAPMRYAQIREVLAESASLYPGIEEWWDSRVAPGLTTGERTCRIVVIDEEIAAIGIGKRGNGSAKLCTLRVCDRYRRCGLGQKLLFETLSDLLETSCRSVHFTISEEIRAESLGFFTRYGFGLASWTRGKYVRGMDELSFAASAKRLRVSLWADRVKNSIKRRFSPPIDAAFKSGMTGFVGIAETAQQHVGPWGFSIASCEFELKSPVNVPTPSFRFASPLIHPASVCVAHTQRPEARRVPQALSPPPGILSNHPL